jgi:hypothetical protein
MGFLDPDVTVGLDALDPRQKRKEKTMRNHSSYLFEAQGELDVVCASHCVDTNSKTI